MTLTSQAKTAPLATGQTQAGDLGRTLYLDLLKKSLTYAMWDEPPVPLDNIADDHLHGTLKRIAYFRFLRPFLQRRDLLLSKTGLSYWARQCHTMMPLGLLSSLQDCVETVIKEKIPGDLIETGVWRGGACMLMKGVLKAYNVQDRRLFVADSFAGLPMPNVEKYPADVGAEFHKWTILAVSLDDVRRNFERYELLDERVIFVKGWFKDTLPTLPSDQLAIMRLDGDLYESTMDSLTNLYHKLSVGGFCIIDDWALPACRKAVIEFRKQNDIKDPITNPGFSDYGVFWRKTS